MGWFIRCLPNYHKYNSLKVLLCISFNSIQSEIKLEEQICKSIKNHRNHFYVTSDLSF